MNGDQARAIDGLILYVHQWRDAPATVSLEAALPTMLSAALQLGSLAGSRDPAIGRAIAERLQWHLTESCRRAHGNAHGRPCGEMTRARFDDVISQLIESWDLAAAPNG